MGECFIIKVPRHYITFPFYQGTQLNEITELIVDAFGCSADLSDHVALEKMAREAVESVGARVATSSCFRFQPHGLTLALILMESHFVLSTWPEKNLAIMNVFLCDNTMDTMKVWEKVAQALNPTHAKFHTVKHSLESHPKTQAA